METCMSLTTSLVDRYHFTLEQYDRMISAGVFAEDEQRVEFLRGEIVPMSPIGTPHWRIVNYLNRWSTTVTSPEEVEVSVQNPVFIPPSESAPEPDLAWLRAKKYDDQAQPEDVLLIIEVAESTIRLDTVVKAAIYAEGGIADYWVVDIPSRVVHTFRHIVQNKYLNINMARPGELLSPLAFPEAQLDIERMFGIL
jgi:Uma2 family endonuclease